MSAKEANLDGTERERLAMLADELDKIQREKTGGHGDVVMQKLIRCLQDGDVYAAKVFLASEMDKFDQYRKDAVPLIIERLYGGNGSPWVTIERKLKAVPPT